MLNLNFVTVWFVCFFFFNDTATTEIYTLSLHDALPISPRGGGPPNTISTHGRASSGNTTLGSSAADRKSTRLNSSHSQISYAVFCLKKKKLTTHLIRMFLLMFIQLLWRTVNFLLVWIPF